jgi:cytosine/adenosine deaminase-related metal-dependent hydrolase
LDIVIKSGTVVTMNGSADVLPGCDVVIRDGRLHRIGKNAARSGARRIIDAEGCAVLPGFIHGHLHACQTLFRNFADGLELLDWLRERIWPFEAAHDEASMRASADLTFAELIRSGATAALDMGTVRHTEVVFESARAAGFRLTGGKAMMDHGQGMPAGLRETTRSSIDESVQLCKAFHGKEEGRLRYAFAPRFVLSCTEELLREVAHIARAHGARIHTHASENATECDLVRQRFGTDNVALLQQLGISGPHVTLAHCVWLTAQEQRMLKDDGTAVCHCPSSNLKLASGIAKIPELLADGVSLCLGADGAACNNNLDMFQEMRLCALLHKVRGGARAMPPMDVLRMATWGGARALGLLSEVGSLEEGKRADVAVVDLSGLHATPSGSDVASALVYSAKGSDVRHVFIGGRHVLKQGQLLTLDEERVRRQARAHAARLAERVG